MPVQKGKRRNRQRRRVGADDRGPELTPSSSITDPTKRNSASPARRGSSTRRRAQIPLWGNVGIAIAIDLVALYLFLSPSRGEGMGQRLLFFFGYLALSVFYWWKAFRQYRARRLAREG
ncbi:MAG: hypothetical protein ACR2JC_14865 [Chloroflexota bacterium]|nr:MAG: hypothetical protein DLM70_03635 [Chloroflexota bacterium]